MKCNPLVLKRIRTFTDGISLSDAVLLNRVLACNSFKFIEHQDDNITLKTIEFKNRTITIIKLVNRQWYANINPFIEPKNMILLMNEDNGDYNCSSFIRVEDNRGCYIGGYDSDNNVNLLLRKVSNKYYSGYYIRRMYHQGDEDAMMEPLFMLYNGVVKETIDIFNLCEDIITAATDNIHNDIRIADINNRLYLNYMIDSQETHSYGYTRSESMLEVLNIVKP